MEKSNIKQQLTQDSFHPAVQQSLRTAARKSMSMRRLIFTKLSPQTYNSLIMLLMVL